MHEHLAFADVDFSSISAYDFGDGEGAARILFRPPAEASHYYRSESRDLALALLRYLAAEGARVVFSPPLARQVRYLDEVTCWHEDPVSCTSRSRSSRCSGVDAVISAGGTMLREAAYMGVPAYSIFRSRIGAVDQHLGSIDRLSIMSSPADFSRVRLKEEPLDRAARKGSRVAEDVMKMIVDRAERTKAASDGSGRFRPVA